MKILHLFSNHRWTERAEPAVLLAWAQQQLGADVTFVCGTSDDPAQNSILPHLEARSLPHFSLELPKHMRVMPLVRDGRALRKYIGERGIDVLHCHTIGAHAAAAFALRSVRNRPQIVRMSYEPEGLDGSLRERYLSRFATDGLIVTTDDGRTTMESRVPRLRGKVAVIEPGIDLDRFSPERSLDCPPEPAQFPADAFVVGIVSRIRRARRLDLVVQAVGILARECPNLHLMIVGQAGSPEKEREAVTQPAIDAGCADRVHLVGYRKADTLVAAYRRMNVLAYPEPGTDRTARTVREAMAAGLPVVASNVGYLPHMIEDGATGFLVEQTAAGFAGALRRLYADRELLRRFAANSLASAQKRFGLDRQAEQTLAFYKQCCGLI